MFLSSILSITYDHTLYHGRKHFSCYCLQAFSTEETLKTALKLMANKELGCLKRVNLLNSKIMKEK